MHDRILLVSKYRVKIENGFFFFLRKFSSFDIRPQVVCPPQSTTLATSV